MCYLQWKKIKQCSLLNYFFGIEGHYNGKHHDPSKFELTQLHVCNIYVYYIIYCLEEEFTCFRLYIIIEHSIIVINSELSYVCVLVVMCMCVRVIYMCVRGVDCAFVSTIIRSNFGIFPTM